MSGSENVRSADKVSVTAVEAKAPGNALDEVLDFCSQTVQHPEARIRQTGTVLQGIVVGGIKDIPNELMNHPLETGVKVAVAGTLGVGAGAALALEIPIITGITIGAGVTMLGFGIADSFKRMADDKQLQGALHNVWKSEDFYTQMQANDTAEKVLGPEAFNWGVTLPAGLVGGFGGNIATKMVAAKLLSGKPAVIPVDTPEFDLANMGIFNTTVNKNRQAALRAYALEKARTGAEQNSDSNTTPTDNAIAKKVDKNTNDQATTPVNYWEAPGWKNPDYIDFHNPTMSAYRAAHGDTRTMETPRYKRMVAEAARQKLEETKTPYSMEEAKADHDPKWEAFNQAAMEHMTAFLKDDFARMQAARAKMDAARPKTESTPSAAQVEDEAREGLKTAFQKMGEAMSNRFNSMTEAEKLEWQKRHDDKPMILDDDF